MRNKRLIEVLPFICLWFVIFSVPWEYAIVIFYPLTVTRILAVVAIVLTLIKVIVFSRIRKLGPIHFFVLLYTLWSVASYIWSIDKLSAIAQITKVIYLFFVVLIVWENCRSTERIRRILQAYIFGAYVAAFGVLSQYSSGTGIYNVLRFGVGEANPNTTAVLICLGIPITWYLLSQNKRRILALLYLAYIPLALISIPLTFSRTAFIATIVCMLYIISGLRITRRKVIVGSFVLAAISSAFQYIPDYVWERMSTIPEQVSNIDMGGRGDVWTAGLQSFVEHPILGVGSGNFRQGVAEFGIDAVGHNAFLMPLVELGLIGFLLFTATVVYAFLQGVKIRKLDRGFMMFLVFIWTLTSSTYTFDDYIHTWFIFTLVASAAALQAPRQLQTERAGNAIPISRQALEHKALPISSATGSKPIDMKV